MPTSKRLFVSLVPAFVVAVMLPYNLIMTDVVVYDSGQVEPTNGPLFLLYALVALFYLGMSIFQLVKTYVSSEALQRRRLQYFIFGAAFFIVTALVFDLVLPAVGLSHLNTLGFFAAIILVIATAYAIVRHQILDIRIVIQRGLIYLGVVGFLVGIYVVLLVAVQSFIVSRASYTPAIVAGFVVVIGVATAVPMERFLRRITDSIFFKGRYQYAQALRSLMRIVYTQRHLDALIKASTHEMENIFRTPNASIILFDDVMAGREFFTKYSSDFKELYIPIIFENEVLGYIQLEPKRSGDLYTIEDKGLLETFSYQLALSLEKARLYDEIAEYSSSLEGLVESRTAEIRDLQQAQEHMMIDISHNLQTPLTIITAEIETLRDAGVADTKLIPFTKSIDSLSRFVYRLLRVAKLGTIASIDTFCTVNLSDRIEESTEYFQTIATENGVRLSAHIERGVVITGIPDELDECCANLVSNAIKYRRDEDAHVQVTLASKDGKAHLTVSDNGRGVSKKELPYIFERMYRGEQQKSITGSGLGLAICKRIVERHHGRITVISEKGNGTMFTVTLPLIKKESQIKKQETNI
jgi:signal transduction histidine kinase